MTKSLLRGMKYTPSTSTDIRKTFRRIRREMTRAQVRPSGSVTPIQKAKAK